MIEIEYEYVADDLLRKKTKHFSNKETENVIVWIFDNFRIEKAIDNVNLQILFEDKIEVDKVVSYPQKNFHTLNDFKNFTMFKWRTKDLKANSFRNFVVNIPLFNENCKDFVSISYFNKFVILD
jgi:hypothetical protein